jgi:hypothetical protein
MKMESRKVVFRDWGERQIGSREGEMLIKESKFQLNRGNTS